MVYTTLATAKRASPLGRSRLSVLRATARIRRNETFPLRALPRQFARERRIVSAARRALRPTAFHKPDDGAIREKHLRVEASSSGASAPGRCCYRERKLGWRFPHFGFATEEITGGPIALPGASRAEHTLASYDPM
jgi:hypothetical protein